MRNIFWEKRCREQTKATNKKAVCMLCLLLTCILTGCGYNSIMFDHLSDRNNYETYTVQIEKMIYPDADTDKAFFWVTFLDYEALDQFMGYEVDREKPLSNYVETFSVIAENHRLLSGNQFYEQISVGDTIEITASDWIYMDGYFYYIIGVRCGETEYLNPEDGLKNVIDMMNRERGLI